MWEKVVTYFLSGLITLLPVFITIWLVWILFSLADGLLGGIISQVLGFYFPGLGLLTVLVLTIIVGYLTTYVFGKRLVHLGERLLYKLPLVNTIYSSVKQVNEILFLQKETGAFRRVCAVEYPRKGIYSIGFVTGLGVPQIKKKYKREFLNVFVPTTPSPATGFMVVVPSREVIMLDMSLEEAAKLIVSGGVLNPKHKSLKG